MNNSSPETPRQSSELSEQTADSHERIDSAKSEADAELNSIARALETALNDPDTDPAALRQLWTTYDQYFEAFVDQADATDVDERAKRQMTGMLRKAFIFEHAGKTLRYLEEIDKAVVYVRNKGFHKLETILDADLVMGIAELKPSPERLILQLRGKISDKNRLYLWNLWANEQDFQSLVNHAREMLRENDEDPDEVLRALGIVE